MKLRRFFRCGRRTPAEEVENPEDQRPSAGVLIGVGDWLSAMPGRSVKITWDAESQRFIFGIRDVDGTGWTRIMAASAARRFPC